LSGNPGLEMHVSKYKSRNAKSRNPDPEIKLSNCRARNPDLEIRCRGTSMATIAYPRAWKIASLNSGVGSVRFPTNECRHDPEPSCFPRSVSPPWVRSKGIPRGSQLPRDHTTPHRHCSVAPGLVPQALTKNGLDLPAAVLTMRHAPLLGIEPLLVLCYLDPIIPVWRSAG
jgi:hypothetical protein